MANTSDSSDESIKNTTSQSHKNMPRGFSRSKIKSEGAKDFSRENEYLRKELSNSKKQLLRLKRKLLALEFNKRKKIKDGSSNLNAITESRSDISPETEVDNDDEFVKSWQVLGNHFSEVIRRHHEVLAEKDRQIRELQEKQYTGEISGSLLDYDSRDFPKDKQNVLLESVEPLCKLKTEPQTESDICEDRCNCADMSGYSNDCLENSGEKLREHFSEVIRRHRQELITKDQQIQELQQALEFCIGPKPPQKQVVESEVQMWYHDYHYHSQSTVKPGDQVAKPGPSPRHIAGASCPLELRRSKMSLEASTTSDEGSDSLIGSTDTFIAMEKCQRLESITNLEKLRQNIMQRLELEEKLDRLYWQTELSRYRALREEAGDSFDPESSLNKNMETLESTRLELLRALSKLRDSAEREPELSVKPHLLFKDSESIVNTKSQFPESESKRYVKFTEEITITTVQTTYEET